MFKVIEYDEVLEKLDDYVLIDVRTPKEFNESTIPGAINIPLFTDEERCEIGTVYTHESIEKAKKMGIEAVAKKLPQIYEKITALYKNHRNLVFFCARGGMRSASITALMNSLSIGSYRIRGGYKGYREFINRELKKQHENLKYIVIHGKTGCGKTEILKNLNDRGYDIVDLEGAANHRGSLLGSVGLGSCRSQKMFESLVYNDLNERKTKYVFIEGESKRIGNVLIPNYIFDSMKDGYHIYVEDNIDNRGKFLVEEYTKSENAKEEILLALERMEKYMGNKKKQKYVELVNDEKYYEVCKELMVDYYDPMYVNSMKKHEFDEKIYINGIDDGVNKLIKWHEDNILSLEE